MNEKRLLWLVRLFFATCSASILTLIILESVSASSAIGEFVLSPQNTLTFIHLPPYSPLGSRITFVALALIISTSIVLILVLFARRRWTGALLRTAPGSAMAAPLVGWLVARPNASFFELLIGTATVGLVATTVYELKKLHSVGKLVMIMNSVTLGVWVDPYYFYLDPVMLTAPVFACLSYVTWLAYISRTLKQGLKPSPA